MVVVDVNNISHYELDNFSYVHFQHGLAALKRWLRGGNYSYKLIADEGYQWSVLDHEIRDAARAVARQEIIKSPFPTADEYVLKEAKKYDGIVAADDHYRDWYEHDHEWMMEERRAVTPSYSPDKGWSWQWADYESHIYSYFHTDDERYGGGPHLPGWPDEPMRTRTDTWRCFPEVSFGLRIPNNRRWPPPGSTLRVHHLVHDFDLPPGEVLAAFKELGFPKRSISSAVTDEEVQQLREALGYGESKSLET
jgi:hypothetical protein